MIIKSDYISGKWTDEQRAKALKLLQSKIPSMIVVKKNVKP
ncbi:hypothetical protein [Streptococcus salivarius]|nr:hypothetical protein [Streptococcus salivarius]